MTAMPELAMVGLTLLVLGLYWLPSILAWVRRHPDLVPIVLVNALLGWTVLGWLWAASMLVRGPAGPPRPATAREDLGAGVAGATSPLPLER